MRHVSYSFLLVLHFSRRVFRSVAVYTYKFILYSSENPNVSLFLFLLLSTIFLDFTLQLIMPRRIYPHSPCISKERSITVSTNFPTWNRKIYFTNIFPARTFVLLAKIKTSSASLIRCSPSPSSLPHFPSWLRSLGPISVHVHPSSNVLFIYLYSLLQLLFLKNRKSSAHSHFHSFKAFQLYSQIDPIMIL